MSTSTTTSSTTAPTTTSPPHYSTDPTWSDITPIPEHNEGKNVVHINASPAFREAMEYFRAILLKEECSERALQLTERVIELNAANYTAWHFRRKILLHLQSDLVKELSFAAKVSQTQPKNYQLWQHRKSLVELLQSPMNELYSTEMSLDLDSKNYHVWSYRQWLLRSFYLKGNIKQDNSSTSSSSSNATTTTTTTSQAIPTLETTVQNECNFTHKLLTDDIRNNSVWNQRYFVLQTFEQFKATSVAREVNYTLQSIEKVKHNESAWNYLEGLSRIPTPQFYQYHETIVFALRLLEDDISNSRCRFAHSYLVDVLSAPACPAIATEIFTNPSSATSTTTSSSSSSSSTTITTADRICNIQQAIHHCSILIALDKVRRKYWRYRQQQLHYMLSLLSPPSSSASNQSNSSSCDGKTPSQPE